MSTLGETRDGQHLPTWSYAPQSPSPDRPKVAHYRNKSAHDDTLYVGRGSALGNPFRLVGGESGRAAAIKKYRAWLWTRMQAGDAQVWSALECIEKDTVLLCHCHPKDCHADVVSKAWQWAKRAGKL